MGSGKQLPSRGFFRDPQVSSGVGEATKVTFKFEVRYDWSKPIPDVEASPSGLALSVGIKKYF